MSALGRLPRWFLRRHYRARLLELGIQDLASGGEAYSLLQRWTVNAARSISSALAISRSSAAHNLAATEPDGIPFVILGMGRLGLSEFDLASDADLVFVAGWGPQRENMERWTHLAEKTIEVLSSYTQDGTIFPVDTRLRPRGQEGELVVTLEELSTYIAEHAQPWELLTYLKAHPLAGDRKLGRAVVERLQAAIDHRLSAFQDFEGELHQMRRRLEREVAGPGANTKTAPGGYYDVDFAVSYTRLRRRIRTMPGANMAEQISALRAADAISAEDAAALARGAAFLRSLDHILRLVTGKVPNGLPETEALAETAESLARKWKLIPEGQALAAHLNETQQSLRYIYRRLTGSE